MFGRGRAARLTRNLAAVQEAAVAEREVHQEELAALARRLVDVQEESRLAMQRLILEKMDAERERDKARAFACAAEAAYAFLHERQAELLAQASEALTRASIDSHSAEGHGEHSWSSCTYALCAADRELAGRLEEESLTEHTPSR